MKRIKLLLSLFLLFSVTTATAQKKVKYLTKNTTKAEKEFNQANYFGAITLFKKAYGKAKTVKEKGFITYKQAYCYKYIAENEKAEKYYELALRLKYEKHNPRVLLDLAQMQMQSGKYKEARRNFEAYLKTDPNNEQALQGAKACKTTPSWTTKFGKTKYKVTAVKELNSDSYDWSFSNYDKRGEQFIFSSTRKASTGNDRDKRTINEDFADLYVSTMDKQGNFGEPVLLGNSINTKNHEASAVIDAKGTTMFFTRCNSGNRKNLGCKIYTSKKQGKNWKTPVMIPLHNDSSTSQGHPAINSRGDVLVFASDMPGGKGGKDLWVSIYNKRTKEWGAPKNLGREINTAGDEKFPTIAKDGSLYFSSNGRMGLGGLDIFVAQKMGNTNRWGKVKNMKYPINSSKDDHGLVFKRNSTNEGYFSSNRLANNDIDKKSDIYKFELPTCELTLKGKVRDQDSLTPLKGATVTLTGSDGTTATIKTDSQGNFKFGKKGSKDRYIKKGVKYTLLFEAENHLNSKSKRSTLDKNLCNETFYDDIKLLCFNCKPIVMPEVQYVLGSEEFINDATISSNDSLMFLYNILKDNPTIGAQLEAHTDCRGSDEANQSLSQRRAQACVDFLISKGIDRSRLVAKGFGESKPRVITVNGKDLTLGCDMITSLGKSHPNYKRYHQLNRRTEFSVIKPEDMKK